jgi:transposase-like protein DUF772
MRDPQARVVPDVRMAMGRREQQRAQEELWIAHTELPRTAAHPFYDQLNRLRRYFRLLLIGYVEGLDGERGIAWRAADSLALRGFLGVELNGGCWSRWLRGIC